MNRKFFLIVSTLLCQLTGLQGSTSPIAIGITDVRISPDGKSIGFSRLQESEDPVDIESLNPGFYFAEYVLNVEDGHLTEVNFPDEIELSKSVTNDWRWGNDGHIYARRGNVLLEYSAENDKVVNTFQFPKQLEFTGEGPGSALTFFELPDSFENVILAYKLKLSSRKELSIFRYQPKKEAAQEILKIKNFRSQYDQVRVTNRRIFITSQNSSTEFRAIYMEDDNSIVDVEGQLPDGYLVIPEFLESTTLSQNEILVYFSGIDTNSSISIYDLKNKEILPAKVTVNLDEMSHLDIKIQGALLDFLRIGEGEKAISDFSEENGNQLLQKLINLFPRSEFTIQEAKIAPERKLVTVISTESPKIYYYLNLSKNQLVRLFSSNPLYSADRYTEATGTLFDWPKASKPVQATLYKSLSNDSNTRNIVVKLDNILIRDDFGINETTHTLNNKGFDVIEIYFPLEITEYYFGIRDEESLNEFVTEFRKNFSELVNVAVTNIQDGNSTNRVWSIWAEDFAAPLALILNEGPWEKIVLINPLLPTNDIESNDFIIQALIQKLSRERSNKNTWKKAISESISEAYYKEIYFGGWTSVFDQRFDWRDNFNRILNWSRNSKIKIEVDHPTKRKIGGSDMIFEIMARDNGIAFLLGEKRPGIHF